LLSRASPAFDPAIVEGGARPSAMVTEPPSGPCFQVEAAVGGAGDHGPAVAQRRAVLDHRARATPGHPGRTRPRSATTSSPALQTERNWVLRAVRLRAPRRRPGDGGRTSCSAVIEEAAWPCATPAGGSSPARFGNCGRDGPLALAPLGGLPAARGPARYGRRRQRTSPSSYILAEADRRPPAGRGGANGRPQGRTRLQPSPTTRC